jgi:hypothetical protein
VVNRPTDAELLDLLRATTDVPQFQPRPPRKPGMIDAFAPQEETAEELRLREFELSRSEYDEEQAMMARVEDDQEPWRELMRDVGRLR